MYVSSKRGEHCRREGSSITEGSTARSTVTAGERSAARQGSTTSVGSTARHDRAARVKSAARKGKSDRKGTTATEGSISVGSTTRMNSSVAK